MTRPEPDLLRRLDSLRGSSLAVFYPIRVIGSTEGSASNHP
jgi:hypothetical protein